MPHQEIKIEFTGLRPGEKMYEELLLDPKTTIKTKNEKIFIEKTELIQFNQKGFDVLIRAAQINDSGIIELLFQQLKITNYHII
jgi:FlaA1/EpsC-like NDP-sugar epimerase